MSLNNDAYSAPLTDGLASINPAHVVEGPFKPLELMTVRPTLRQIRDRTAEYFGISQADIAGPCRMKNLVRPRQAAMYLARKCTRQSFPQIGKAFGGRDHTTVMHAWRQITRLIAEGDDIAAHVVALEMELAPRQKFNPCVSVVIPESNGVA